MIAFSANLRIEVVDQVTEVVRRINRSIGELGGRATVAARGSLKDLNGRLGKLNELTGNASPRLRALSDILPALGAFQIGRVLGGSAEKAREILQLARSTGVATGRLQELLFAAQETGIGAAALGKSLTTLTKSVARAKGGGAEAVEAFAALGLTVEGLKALSPDQVFSRAADGIARIEDPARRAELAAALFGESGAELMPLLLEGSGGIDRMAASAREAGLILSEEALRSAEGARGAFAGLSATVSGLGAALGIEMLGALKPVIEAIGGLVKRHPGIAKAFLAMTAGAVAATAAVALLGAAFSPLTLGVAAVAAAVVGIGFAVTAAYQAFVDATGGFGAIWERLKGFFIDNIDRIAATLSAMVSVLFQAWSSVTGYFARVWSEVTGIFSSALDQISAAFDGGFIAGVLALPGIVGDAMNDVVEAIFGIDLREIGRQWMEPFKAAIGASWDQIGALFENAGIDLANEAIGLINDQIDRINKLADFFGADFLKIDRIAEFGPATPSASDAAQPGFLPDGSLALKTQNEIGIGLKLEAPPGFKLTHSTTTRRDTEDDVFYRGVSLVAND